MTEKTGRSIAVRAAGGKVLRIPTAQVHMDWGSGYRDVEVGVMRDIPTDVLLGNDLGHLSSSFHVYLSPEAFPVTTRQQDRRAEKALDDGTQVRPNFPNPDQTVPPVTWATSTDFTWELLSDPMLASYWKKAGMDPGD